MLLITRAAPLAARTGKAPERWQERRGNRTAARELQDLLHPDRAAARASRSQRAENRSAARELKRLLRPDLDLLTTPKPRKADAGEHALAKASQDQLLREVVRGCNKTTAANKRKAGGRARLCLRPEVADASRASAVPLLWSRELRRAQPEFVNEKPFATRKFDPFLDLLPEASSLQHTWLEASEDRW